MSKRRQKLKSKEKKSFPIDLYFLIISTIVVLPLVYTERVVDPTLSPRLFALGIILAVTYGLILFKKKHNKPDFSFLNKSIFIVYFLYLVWSVIISFFAINPSEALYDLSKTFLTIALLVYFTHIFLTYKITISLLVKLVVLSSIFATALGLYQYFESVPGKTGRALFESLYGIKGLMAHKNQFAISLFLMLPFSIYGIFINKKYWRLISIYSSIMILLSIFVVQTRSVWVATFIFILLVSLFAAIIFFKKVKSDWSKYKRIMIIVGVAVFLMSTAGTIIIKKTGTLELIEYKITSIFNPESVDNQGRLTMWKSTLRLSQDNLVTGVGPGNWKLNITKYFPYNISYKFQNWRRPHNDFLWILSERGIAGLVVFLSIFFILLYYVFIILRRETDAKKLLLVVIISSGVVGYLVISMFSFPSERINHQVYLSIMMAIIIGTYYENSKTRNYLSPKLTKNFYLLALLLIIPIIYYSNAYIQSEISIQKLKFFRSKNDWNRVIKFSDEAFSKFITIDAFNDPIGLHKGEAYLNLKKYKQAHSALNKALKYCPNNISVLNNMAIASAEMNDTKQAISYIDQGLTIYPRYEASLFNKANIYLKVGDLDRSYIALLSCYNKKDKEEKYYTLMGYLKRQVDLKK